MTVFYRRHTLENWLDFLARVERWLPPQFDQVVAVLDNHGTHHGFEVLLFMLAHPRWEFLFIPSRAGYLNLIEPWWGILRPMVFKGRTFHSLDELKQALQGATAYWNAHKHPFFWGQRRRHQPKRKPGIALMPGIPHLIENRLPA
jgi:hypothetical protein